MILRHRLRDKHGSQWVSTDETLFALHDAQGSIIAIADTNGVIVQQFYYDIDGGVTGTSAFISLTSWQNRFDWRLLWRQMRLSSTKTSAISSAVKETYHIYSTGNGQFYAPSAAKWLQADFGTEMQARERSARAAYFAGSQFDGGFLGLSRFFHSNAESFVTGSKLFITAGVSYLSGGSLTFTAMAFMGLSGTEARYMNGSSMGSSIWGGIRDATGFSSIEAVIGGVDPITGEDLGFSERAGYGVDAAFLGAGTTRMLRGLGVSGRTVLRYGLYAGVAYGGASLFIGDGVSAAFGVVSLFTKVEKMARGAYRLHRNGAAGEVLMGRWLRRYHPGEIIVAKPGAIGRHGADWITVNSKTGTVSLWDAKFRSTLRNVRMSSTFARSGNTNPLKNAVGEAWNIIDIQKLSPMLSSMQREAARLSLLNGGTGFNLYTRGFGKSSNLVSDLKVVRWW